MKIHRLASYKDRTIEVVEEIISDQTSLYHVVLNVRGYPKCWTYNLPDMEQAVIHWRWYCQFYRNKGQDFQEVRHETT